MAKILVTIVVTVFLVLFGMQNSDHVPVSLIVGSPKNVRLGFLLAVAASSGFIFSYIRSIGEQAKLRREIGRLTQLCKSALAKIPDQGRTGEFDA